MILIPVGIYWFCAVKKWGYSLLNETFDKRIVLNFAWRVWCGVVWCGVVWCGVVWCSVAWCGDGAVWNGLVWLG